MHNPELEELPKDVLQAGNGAEGRGQVRSQAFQCAIFGVERSVFG